MKTVISSRLAFLQAARLSRQADTSEGQREKRGMAGFSESSVASAASPADFLDDQLGTTRAAAARTHHRGGDICSEPADAP